MNAVIGRSIFNLTYLPDTFYLQADISDYCHYSDCCPTRDNFTNINPVY
jgi:hypothetical protein